MCYIRVMLNGKKANLKIGSKSEGVNITYAYNKKKEFDDIANTFFNYKLEKEPDNATNIKEQRRDYEIYHKDKLGSLATTQITPEMINEHHKDISQIASPKTKCKLSQSRINTIMGISHKSH